jgi:hypothetical protein
MRYQGNCSIKRKKGTGKLKNEKLIEGFLLNPKMFELKCYKNSQLTFFQFVGVFHGSILLRFLIRFLLRFFGQISRCSSVTHVRMQSFGYITLIFKVLLFQFRLFRCQCFSLVSELFFNSLNIEFFIFVLPVFSSSASSESSGQPVLVIPCELLVHQDIDSINLAAITSIVCDISCPRFLKLDKSISSRLLSF